MWQEGIIISKAQDKEAVTPYEMYYDYQETLKNLPPHRILALNRGAKEKVLQVKLQEPEEKIIALIEEKYMSKVAVSCQEQVLEALKDGYKRLVSPQIEREVRNELTSIAEEQAIKVFARISIIFFYKLP